ncbi:MAG: TonB-dependent receptor [Cyclobacteriaceae bacterium]|nr:TonB-dependent receptor [Cyclobacteriaceae bacterium]
MNKVLLLISLSFLIICPLVAQDAQSTITGMVTGINGDPIPGVNIFIQNTTIGTISEFDGSYEINVPAEAQFIVFSYIGYLTTEEPIDNRSIINVVLLEDTKQLEEIVVTGYTSQKKADVIGSISSINPESVKDMPIIGIDQALQGQVSGVSVTQSSGTPGGGIMVRVRGNSSISSANQPMYIIDGIPVRDGRLSTRNFGGQNDNALSTINPNDIESIEILKDASAKAIYGSRAANGVVLITTKRGKKGAPTSFDIDVQRGIINPTNTIEVLNATELLALQREALANADENPDDAGLPGVTDAVNTDWQDAVMRQAIVEQYQISTRGGSEKTQFYMSASYRAEEGVMLNNDFKRATFTTNLDHQANERLSLGLNLNFARTKNNRVKGDNFLDGVYNAAITSLPYYTPYDEDGKLIAPGDAGYAEIPNFNPVGQAIEPRFDTYATKVLGGLFAKYEILPNLMLISKVNVDYLTTIEDQFEPTTTAIGGWLESVGSQGYGIYSTSEASTLLNNNVLTYNTSIGAIHEISALAGTEFISRTFRSGSTTGILFPSNEFTYLSSAGLILDGSSFLVNSGLISFFGEANYKYKSKYLAKVSARYDGSSRFGEDRKYGFFPAFSVGWRMTEEEFLKDYSWLDDLKLRVSYGLTGNERIGDFQYLATWNATIAYNGVPGTAPATLGNPNLGWEQNTEFNVGSDLALFAGRFQFTFDYYYNVTNNLLLNEALPYTTGFSSILGNLGEITNEGIELTITAVNVDKALRWTSQFNISGNKNIVQKLATDEPQFPGYQTFTNSTHIIAPGKPLGTFWGLKYLGVDPGTGDAIYYDKNNDGQLTASDGTFIGDAQPDFFGGFTNTLRYKGFDFTAFLQFSYGNEMINFGNTTLLNSGEEIKNNQSVKALKRWKKEGDITSVPKYEFGNTENNRFSSRFVEDASFLRLKNISLGYTLGEVMLAKLRLNGLRIYASGTNLWTLTNYSGADPEVNSIDGSSTAQGLDLYTFPQVKTILIGLNISF